MPIKSGYHYIGGFIKLQGKGMKCNKLYTPVYFFILSAKQGVN